MGVPQNRERVFVVSILGQDNTYSFPKKQPLHKRLKDILEDNVADNFYLSQDKANQLIVKSKDPEAIIQDQSQSHRDEEKPVRGYNEYAPCLSAREYKDPRLVNETIRVQQIGNIYAKDNQPDYNPQAGRIYNDKGLSPALDTMQGGNRMPKVIAIGNVNPSGRGINGNVISEDGLAVTVTTNKGEGQKVLIKNATTLGYLEARDGDGIDLAYSTLNTRRGRVQPEMSQTVTTQNNLGVLEFPSIAASRGRYNEDGKAVQQLEVNGEGTSNTLTTVQKDNYVVEPQYRIRKLTPLECWRLMAFKDEDFYKAQAVNSNSQLYKQAGNSIVVSVLEGIFRNLFEEQFILNS